jgi:hypothetical protein
VIPRTLQGTREILATDTWLPRPGTITVIVGAPITPASGEWREIVRLRDRTREEIDTTLTAAGQLPR